MGRPESRAETVASSGYVACWFRDSSHRNGETCEDINECDVWNGAAACHLCTCNNLIIRFSCACPTGFRSVAGEGNEMCDGEVCGTAPPIQHLSRNDTSVNWYVALRSVGKALVRNSEVGKTLLCVPIFVFLKQLALRASCGAIITVTFTLMLSIIIIYCFMLPSSKLQCA